MTIISGGRYFQYQNTLNAKNQKAPPPHPNPPKTNPKTITTQKQTHTQNVHDVYISRAKDILS